jgi:hypothetical protein
MRTIKTIAVILLLASGIAQTQERAVIVEKGKDRFETEFAPGGRLRLEVRSGDVRISGTDHKKISVHYEGRRRDDVGSVVVRYKNLAGSAVLEISGGPRNEFQTWIEIPHETDLRVRMPFGELDIAKVRGDRDLEIFAGQLTTDIGDPKDYSQIEASVLTGELNLRALGVDKGGLFRSYKKNGPGKHKLYAHVTCGEIDLQ